MNTSVVALSLLISAPLAFSAQADLTCESGDLSLKITESSTRRIELLPTGAGISSTYFTATLREKVGASISVTPFKLLTKKSQGSEDLYENQTMYIPWETPQGKVSDYSQVRITIRNDIAEVRGKDVPDSFKREVFHCN